MENNRSNYFDIASNEYKFLKATPVATEYNNILSVLCQQVCEKLLKHVVETSYTDAQSQLRTHNLKRLYDCVSREITLSRESELYLSTLSDYYFDARYPGDDFVNVPDKELVTIMAVTDELYDVVADWNNNRQKNKSANALIEAAKIANGVKL